METHGVSQFAKLYDILNDYAAIEAAIWRSFMLRAMPEMKTEETITLTIPPWVEQAVASGEMSLGIFADWISVESFGQYDALADKVRKLEYIRCDKRRAVNMPNEQWRTRLTEHKGETSSNGKDYVGFSLIHLLARIVNDNHTGWYRSGNTGLTDLTPQTIGNRAADGFIHGTPD